MINNIVLISISFDFFVARHLVNLSIERKLTAPDVEEVDVEPAAHPCARIELFGAPYILGQCILPLDLFSRLSLPLANLSPNHQGWGESPVLRLNGSLQHTQGDLGPVRLFTGNSDAHIILMELQLMRATKFLIEDFLQSDFSQIANTTDRQGMQDLARKFLARNENEIAVSKRQYAARSGIELP